MHARAKVMSLSQDEDDHYAVSTSCVVGYVRQRVEVGLGVPLVGSAQQLDLSELLDNPPHNLLKSLRRHDLTTERIARGSTVDTRPTTPPYTPMEPCDLTFPFLLRMLWYSADMRCHTETARPIRAAERFQKELSEPTDLWHHHGQQLLRSGARDLGGLPQQSLVKWPASHVDQARRQHQVHVLLDLASNDPLGLAPYRAQGRRQRVSHVPGVVRHGPMASSLLRMSGS